MSVEEAYYRAAQAMEWWVRLVEEPTRRMQAAESSGVRGRRLAICTPRDSGIPLLEACRFRVVASRRFSRFGFPMEYLRAERVSAAAGAG